MLPCPVVTLPRAVFLLAPLLAAPVLAACRASGAADSIRVAPGHAICPVCQAEGDLACEDVTIAADTPRSERLGIAYYFCSADCKRAFDRDPERFVSR